MNALIGGAILEGRRPMQLRPWLRLAAILIAVLCAMPAVAESESPGQSPVGVRQQRVARMMQELEQRFLALARSLEKAEPERAARLMKAFEESKTLLIESRMREIASLLDSAKLENAGEEQTQVIDDMHKLMAILLAENSDREKKEEIARLKEWHRQVSMLVKEEQQQKKESQKFDKKDAALDKLAKQIEAVQELIRREQELVTQTARVRAEGVSGLNKLADKQETIRRDTDFVAQDIAKTSAGESSPAAAQASSNPSDPAAGQKPLEEAVKNQQSAEKNLAAAQGKTAQQDEEKALEELKKALAELEKERDRLQKPPENAFDKMAEKQEATAKKTESLNDQVSKAGQGSKPGSGACSACSKCLGGACKSMQSASNSLKKKSPGSASSEQKKAEEELEKAKKEIEKRLAELGEKMDDEVIVRLEDIFREMLARQQKATAETVQIHADRVVEGREQELRRAVRVTLRRLMAEEQELAGMAQQALTLIEEDGTSVSFPVVVANMKDNLNQVASWLETQSTGEETQTLQHEIEKTLEELIEALQVAKKGGSGKGGKPGNCKPCLLPNTAELKLLRALQLRVNRRTAAFDKAHAAGKLEPPQKAEVGRIAKVQKEIAGMVQAIVERAAAPPIQPLLPLGGAPDLDFRKGG
jgi:hypothetical protein